MLTARKIFIALPIYGDVSIAFANSLHHALVKPPWPFVVSQYIGDSLVPRPRNSLAADFLESDCTHLLFIDSDLIFTPADVARITSHDEDFVCGIYPKKQDGPLKWCGEGPVPLRPNTGLHEMHFMPTGFMCLSRAVFERLIAARAVDPYHRTEDNRLEHDFFSVGVRCDDHGVPRYFSEDWSFCLFWRKAAGKVWADTHVILKHIGRATYPLIGQIGDLP